MSMNLSLIQVTQKKHITVITNHYRPTVCWSTASNYSSCTALRLPENFARPTEVILKYFDIWGQSAQRELMYMAHRQFWEHLRILSVPCCPKNSKGVEVHTANGCLYIYLFHSCWFFIAIASQTVVTTVGFLGTFFFIKSEIKSDYRKCIKIIIMIIIYLFF